MKKIIQSWNYGETFHSYAVQQCEQSNAHPPIIRSEEVWNCITKGLMYTTGMYHEEVVCSFSCFRLIYFPHEKMDFLTVLLRNLGERALIAFSESIGTIDKRRSCLAISASIKSRCQRIDHYELLACYFIYLATVEYIPGWVSRPLQVC